MGRKALPHLSGRAGGARLKSPAELRALLVEAVPVLVFVQMVSARAVKVCGPISEAFAAIAESKGFDAYVARLPGHFVVEVLTSAGLFEVDLSYIQFSCRSHDDVRNAVRTVAQNPFRAIRVRPIPNGPTGRRPIADNEAFSFTPRASYPEWKDRTDAAMRGEWDPELHALEMRVTGGRPYADELDVGESLHTLGAAYGTEIGKKITSAEELNRTPVGMIVRTRDGAVEFLRVETTKSGWERVRDTGSGLKPTGERGIKVFAAILKFLQNEPLYVVPPRELG